MAKAVFFVKSIVNKWRPPFGKDITEADIVVAEGECFDATEKEGAIFKLLKCNGNKALVQFSEKFTLKGHEHPRNRQVWIGMQEATDFTYLWGNDGITKSLLLKETTKEDGAAPAEEAEKPVQEAIK
ncbi:MAG: hypothetical protein WC634_04705 [archaeon]